MVTNTEYLTPIQFSEKHQAFPIGGLRHRIFYAGQNGLDASGALIRDGRKILIHESRFFDWLETRSVTEVSL